MERGVWKLLVTVSVAVSVILVGGCTNVENGTPDSPEATVTEPIQQDSSRSELTGLAFVRDDAVWVVEDGTERLISNAENPRGLAFTRTGDALTYIADTPEGATVYTTAVGDWRVEALWENSYGSMLEVAYHDDISDSIWFSIVGEAQVSLNVIDLQDKSEQPIDTTFEPSGWFSVRYEDNTLFATDALQNPTQLFLVTEEGETTLLAESAAMWSPRLSSDGTTLITTALDEDGADPHVLIIDVASGAVRTIQPPEGVWPTPPAISPDGRRAAVPDVNSGSTFLLDVTAGSFSDTGLLVEEGRVAW